METLNIVMGIVGNLAVISLIAWMIIKHKN